MYRCLPLLLLVALIPGCGLLCDLFGPCETETGSPELKAFESEKALADYFTQQITARNDRFADTGTLGRADEAFLDFTTEDGAGEPSGGEGEAPIAQGPPSPVPTDGADTGVSDDDFSQTTVQEEGVDESDVVKTDGTYLYIIHSTYGESVLRIVRVSPPEQLALVKEVPLEGNGREIYLHDDKVVALTETGGGLYYFGEGGIAIEPIAAQVIDVTADVVADDDVGTDAGEPGVVDEPMYQRPSTYVTVVDVSLRDSPAPLSKTRFEGSQYSSRMIDGVLHLVLANYQDYYYDVLPMLGQRELDLSSIDIETLLPNFEHVDADGGEASGNMVTWQEMYRPTDPDGFGVVSVVSVDVDNNAEFSAVGVVAEPGLIYSSLNALYLTDTEYDFTGNTRETTDIYKIAYADRAAQPVATGSVPGRVLNQYSVGEYGGYLRVATTVSGEFSWWEMRSEPYNNVYVLGQVGFALEEVGSIVNIAPGEEIMSARFIGDRGYLVTFEQIDPLFTLNLADPTNPVIVGELKVPGYSTFIVPIDADHLLTVGQHIPEDGFFGWGVQLSIFDVSDLANPVRTDDVVLGEQGGASSEALYNPKAFTYFADRGLVALPVSIYEYSPFFDIDFDDEGTITVTDDEAVPDVSDEPLPDDPVDGGEVIVPGGFDGLAVFSVSVEDGFSELGRISTRFEEAGYYWASFTRGVFISEDVFAVTDRGVRGAPVSDMRSAPYELVFESTTPPERPWPAGDD